MLPTWHATYPSVYGPRDVQLAVEHAESLGVLLNGVLDERCRSRFRCRLEFQWDPRRLTIDAVQVITWLDRGVFRAEDDADAEIGDATGG